MERYLFFANLPYALDILRPLQEEILRRGGEAAWFLNGMDSRRLQQDERLLSTVDEVKSYAPLAVYVPGNWVPDFFPGVKVQVFHGLANDRTGKKGHYIIRHLFDLYCTHAEEMTGIYRRLAERHGTFRVIETGWPKLDPLFRGGRPGLRDKLATDKPVVLYASTFSPSLESASRLTGTIERLSGEGRCHWLVTMHPKVDPAIVQQYRDLQGPDLTFADSADGVLPLLQTADVMLCDTSSIALEFMLLDKPVVTFRTKFPGPHVMDVRDPDEIGPAIERAMAGPRPTLEAARAYVDLLHPYRDGASSARVLDATHEFIREHAGTLKPKPLNLWRRIKIRNRMQYYHLR